MLVKWLSPSPIISPVWILYTARSSETKALTFLIKMEENLPLFHIAPSKHSRFLFRLYRFWYGCKNYKELKFSQREFFWFRWHNAVPENGNWSWNSNWPADQMIRSEIWWFSLPKRTAQCINKCPLFQIWSACPCGYCQKSNMTWWSL